MKDGERSISSLVTGVVVVVEDAMMGGEIKRKGFLDLLYVNLNIENDLRQIVLNEMTRWFDISATIKFP